MMRKSSIQGSAQSSTVPVMHREMKHATKHIPLCENHAQRGSTRYSVAPPFRQSDPRPAKAHPRPALNTNPGAPPTQRIRGLRKLVREKLELREVSGARCSAAGAKACCSPWCSRESTRRIMRRSDVHHAMSLERVFRLPTPTYQSSNQSLWSARNAKR
ncbi:hypothetical protein K458DRAFT_201330 [Lentithecium fluviatile CBS 122367]|uniref:Uncharacterized protein n=1 Tax=Lentithecium fluviatile CBS 122367 TaxID=1168545 RepID=A0A6G1J937_9PLEO|nr:hypothetical protein K458DRAFT_201330 [Lentithecium fluviatile CBS 122367]